MKPEEIKINIKGKGLKDIEKRILEIKLEIANQERIQHRPIGMELLKLKIEKANKPLRAELEILEKQRNFMIDRRNNLFWRITWNFVTPVIVSILTAYLTLKVIL